MHAIHADDLVVCVIHIPLSLSSAAAHFSHFHPHYIPPFTPPGPRLHQQPGGAPRGGPEAGRPAGQEGVNKCGKGHLRIRISGPPPLSHMR